MAILFPAVGTFGDSIRREKELVKCNVASDDDPAKPCGGRLWFEIVTSTDQEIHVLAKCAHCERQQVLAFDVSKAHPLEPYARR